MGRAGEAVPVLSEAVRREPAYLPGRLFHILALHNAGRHARALGLALTLLLDAADTAALAPYGDVLRRYCLQVAEEGPPAG